MRRKITAGNWKMNTSLQEGIQLAKEISESANNIQGKGIEMIIAPPFTHLTEINNILNNSFISVSAQNCSSEPKGAFTGEISPEMIKSTGTEYVIIGHSERRSYFSEPNDILNKKVKLTLESKLSPIFCCGERLKERENKIHFSIVEKQIEEGLFDLSEDDFKNVIIAYEPVWAIGTGKTASPEQAQEMHEFIRNVISKKYGTTISNDTPILYGGSCKPSNAKEIFSQPDVDGGLIGGASLNAQDFIIIADSF